MTFLDELDDPEVKSALHRAEIGLTSRHQALMLYGLLGVQVGLAMLFFGAQPTVEAAFGPWSRVWFGLSALLGGTLVSVGALVGDRTPRGWMACFAGATTLHLWCMIMAITYAISAAHVGMDFSYPWDPQPMPAETARLFVPLLYQTMGLLVGLHVVTLARMGRPKH